MARPRRQIAWIWPTLLLAGLAAVVAFRMWSGWATRPMVASTGRTEGRVAGEQADLAAAGRQLRRLQVRATATASRLAAVQAELAAKHQQILTLDEMLDTGRLTECPPFLRDETTVRALQKIIREAGGPAQADAGQGSRLGTAAVIARERLRAKLSTIRSQLDREALDLEDRASALRHEQQLQEADLRQLRRQIDQRLDTRVTDPEAPATPDSAMEPRG